MKDYLDDKTTLLKHGNDDKITMIKVDVDATIALMIT